MNKAVFWVSDQVYNKLSYASTADSKREILDFKVEELYYPCSENKGADQLRSNSADLRLFRTGKNVVFS